MKANLCGVLAGSEAGGELFEWVDVVAKTSKDVAELMCVMLNQLEFPGDINEVVERPVLELTGCAR